MPFIPNLFKEIKEIYESAVEVKTQNLKLFIIVCILSLIICGSVLYLNFNKHDEITKVNLSLKEEINKKNFEIQ